MQHVNRTHQGKEQLEGRCCVALTGTRGSYDCDQPIFAKILAVIYTSVEVPIFRVYKG